MEHEMDGPGARGTGDRTDHGAMVEMHLMASTGFVVDGTMSIQYMWRSTHSHSPRM